MGLDGSGAGTHGGRASGASGPHSLPPTSHSFSIPVQIARRALDALTGAISSSGGGPDVAATEEGPGIAGSGASGGAAVGLPPTTV